MIKKGVCILLIITLSFSLSGCWNYVGLNQLAIVAGVAIDKDTASGNYQLTFEIVDLSGSSVQSGVKSQIVESQGNTIFDAIRNAKKRLLNKLYFPSMDIIVVSNQIAREEGINSVIDFFMRDAEPRETLYFVVSQEATAKDIITNKGIESTIVSYEISSVIKEDNRVTASTRSVPLYKAFSALNSPGLSLVLPAFHSATNDKDKVAESNGIAAFKKDKLVGYLTSDETLYYLFAANDINGGVLMCNPDSGQQNTISLEIKSNSTQVSHSYTGNKIKLIIKTKTDVYLDEAALKIDISNEQELNKIKKAAEETIKQKTTEVIHKVQSEFDSDIFGFGNKVYKTDLKLWNQIGENWDAQFKTMDFDVEPEVEIVNTGALKKN